MHTAASITLDRSPASRPALDDRTADLRNVIAQALRASAAEMQWAADLEHHMVSLNGAFRLWLAIAARLKALNLEPEELIAVRRNCVFTVDTLRTLAGVSDFQVDALVSISLQTAHLLGCGSLPSDRPTLELVEELESWRMPMWVG